MSPVNYVFNISHPITNKKLYTAKLTQYNSSTTAGLVSAISTDGNTIFDPGAFTLEFTYAYDGLLPTLTAFEVLSGIAFTDPPSKFNIRLKTSDKLLLDFQANIADAYFPNCNYLVTNNIPADRLFYAIIITPGLREFAIDMLPSWPTSPPSLGTVIRRGIVGEVAIYPILSDRLLITKSRRAKTYYINRLLKMGYTMFQIVPSSFYSSYISVYMTFPSYELRQLFMEGNLALNGCLSDKGRIY